MSGTIPELGGLLSEDLTFATTASGPIGLGPAYMSVAVPDTAWLGLQELHHRSLGQRGDDSFFAQAAAGMTPDQAFGTFSAGLAGVLAQLGVTDSGAGDRILGSLTDYAGAYGSLAGLEAPFLSSFASAMRNPMSPSLDAAAELWQQLGVPDQLGGGAQTTPIVNPATGQVAFPTADKLMSTVGPSAPPASPPGSSGSPVGLVTSTLADGIDKIFNSGTTSSGAPSPFPHTDSKGAAVALVEWGAMTVAGVASGNPLAAAGAFIFGLFNFVVKLGGSGDTTTPAAVQPVTALDAAGKRVAEGVGIVVGQTAVTNQQGKPVAVDKNGGTHSSGSAPAPSGPAPPPDKKVIAPSSPAKCWRDDDGNLNPDFSAPYWQDSIVLAPALVPIGPGIDALVVDVGAGISQLAALPSLDAAGVVESGGFLSEAFVPVSSRGRVAVLA